MKKNLPYSQFVGIFLLIADFIIIDFSCKLAYYLRFGSNTNHEDYYVSLFVIFNLAWIASALFNNVYNLETLFKFKVLLTKIFYAFVFHALLMFSYIISFKEHDFARLFLFYSYILAFDAIIFFRIIFILFLKYFKMAGINEKRVVIVGAGYAGNELYHYFIKDKSLGYRFMGFFDDAPEIPSLMIKGKIKHLKDYCIKENVDEIYYALSLTSNDLIKDLADFCDDNFIYFKIAPDFRGLVQKKVNIDFYENIPIMTFRREPLGIAFNRVVKRAFDIAFSLMVICFIFPFIVPVIAFLIKLESKGPIFFKQLRPGRKNKLFECYKFRTMRVNNQTELQATKADPRVTKVGKFLRKTSLDELPQFFNVLLGDMSVVGPRPNLITQLEEYSKIIDKYAVRHFVSPGITGYAQVNGYRGETKQVQLMQKRVEYDVMYMENWSFFLDLKIIFLTVWNMIKGEENAY